MKLRQTLGALVLLVGCTTTPSSQTVHEVRVQQHTNAFLQTEEVVSWSVRSYTDQRGNRWPVGLTLSARVVRDHEGAQRRVLMLRKDTVSTDKDIAVYEQVNAERKRLQQECTTTTLVQDGQPMKLPVYSVMVRALTRSDRMPVAATDSTPDPVEVMVGKNSSDQFVVSTTLRVHVDKEVWKTLASAQQLKYELCGDPAEATSAEIDGLRELIAQSR